MKSLIVYYSYSGNTRKIAQDLTEHLKQRSEVEIVELKAKDEPANFFSQCKRAFWHTRADIGAVNFDLSAYDLICLGSPVWAFGPAPAVNAFLNKCCGISGKEAILFTTYGSGTGNQRCLDYMRDILANKGAKGFKRFSIQQNKVANKDYVLQVIKEIIS
jgi:flavodoxin